MQMILRHKARHNALAIGVVRNGMRKLQVISQLAPIAQVFHGSGAHDL
jgi:hypothetical protein